MFKFFKKKDSNLTKDSVSNPLKESEKEWEELKSKYEKEQEQFGKQVDRNMKGIELEKAGEIEGAIKLYEENLKENFEGNHPYDRLAIIYRRMKLFDEEKRVLEKAIEVFSTNISSKRADKDPKLKRFKDRLKTVNDKHLKA